MPIFWLLNTAELVNLPDANLGSSIVFQPQIVEAARGDQASYSLLKLQSGDQGTDTLITLRRQEKYWAGSRNLTISKSLSKPLGNGIPVIKRL